MYRFVGLLILASLLYSGEAVYAKNSEYKQLFDLTLDNIYEKLEDAYNGDSFLFDKTSEITHCEQHISYKYMNIGQDTTMGIFYATNYTYIQKIMFVVRVSYYQEIMKCLEGMGRYSECLQLIIHLIDKNINNKDYRRIMERVGMLAIGKYENCEIIYKGVKFTAYEDSGNYILEIDPVSVE